jgi:oligoendopeptidase F
MQANAAIQKPPRHFLPESFELTTWEALEPYFKALEDQPLQSVEALEGWLKNLSELEAVISEDASWRQIRMTCDTTNEAYRNAFVYFCTGIQPRLQPYAFALNKKLLACAWTKDLDQKKYFTYLRSVKKSVELFREKNVPLISSLSVLQQRYGEITGAMTIEVEGKEYTLQQASRFLESTDRPLRENVFRKTAARRLQDRDALDDLFSQLVSGRDQIARNADFDNYRDYKFEELGRFDYTKEECFAFHAAVREHVVPLSRQILEQHKRKLKLDTLRPWDSEAEPKGVKPLEPFQTGEELLDKAVECFTRLRPFFGDCLRAMKNMQRLDLESRKGKAPGGYNCPLAETGVPFIFMNAAGQMKDVTTILHEGGHAVQAFLTHGLELSAFKEYPMEIAEVASMSMELFTMDYWDIFFDNPEDLRRAKLQQLERVITIFPWIATIDKFQHWIYTHAGHSTAERTEAWTRIQDEFSAHVVDWSGFEDYRSCSWQRQLHLYEVPFYYIEYGIAQLGAIAMWKQYRENSGQALDNYMKALALGYTVPLRDLYAAAGIPFDFSPAYVNSLVSFVRGEMEKLQD